MPSHPKSALQRLLLIGMGLTMPGLRAPAQEEAAAATPTHLLVAFSAPGEETYAEAFAEEASHWRTVGEDPAVACRILGAGADGPVTGASRENLLQTLDAIPPEADLWIILSGHGTWDGRRARFNLAGGDLGPEDLAPLLARRSGDLVLVVSSPSSAPFLSALSGPGRVLVSATKSGDEIHATRFGGFFAEAIHDPGSDIDADGGISLLESFLAASRKVDDFYETEQRLCTEHALIDDNGDRRGTPAAWFHGIRPDLKPKDVKLKPDGRRAAQLHLLPAPADANLTREQRQARDRLESAILGLRDRREELEEAEYYAELERLAMELARLYHPEEN